MYCFDEENNRYGTNSVKWDVCDRAFGGENLQPMWIADMDFKVAPGIVKHLQKKLDQQIFGYGTLPGEYYDAVIGWMSRRHHYDIKKEWICFTPGVISALNYGVKCVSEPGDEIMVLTPVYDPFYHAIEDQGRKAVRVPLHNENGYYTMDFEKMEEMTTNRTKALVLCSPHNPVGRVWTRDELEKLADFIIRHDMYVVDDEIHNDLVYGQVHIMLGRISREMEQRSIMCTAPSKTFNLAGLQTSNAIIPNEALYQKFRTMVYQGHAFSPNSFGAEALIGAYTESDQWLDELLVYLKGNVTFFADYMNTHLPKLKVWPAEGTYFAWVDCSELGFTTEKELKEFFVQKCHLALNWGGSYGEQCTQYMRFNLGCPRAYIEKALKNIEAAMKERG